MLQLLHLTCFLMPAFHRRTDHVHVHVHVRIRPATSPLRAAIGVFQSSHTARYMRRTVQNVDVNVVVVVVVVDLGRPQEATLVRRVGTFSEATALPLHSVEPGY